MVGLGLVWPPQRLRMKQVWHWPGSRWWRVDLHVHSPASYDFTPQISEEKGWRAWLKSATRAGLDAVAVTDHNTAVAISELRSASAGLQNDLVLFPGVEITASDGVHLLVLMDPTKMQEHVEELLSKVEIGTEQRGLRCARSSFNVEKILETLGPHAVLVGAHVNRRRGILTEHTGQQRLAVLGSKHLAAVEVDPTEEVDETWLDGSKPQVGRPACIWSSDAHALDKVGRRFTWVKMTRPDIQGLRLALLDGPASVKPATCDDPGDPNARHGPMLIEKITVSDAKFMGRGEPMKVRFNPWLNAIIGGRGTGKSTLVDLCRKTLRRDSDLEGRDPLGEQARLKKRFDERLPTSPSPRSDGLLTKDTQVELIYRKHGERFSITWGVQVDAPAIRRLVAEGAVSEEGSVYERFPIRIFSQKQLFAMAQDPDGLLAIIDDSPIVRAAERKREINHLKSVYLSLRAQARALAERSGILASRNAALVDINSKLRFLQSGGYTDRLVDYQRRSLQDDTWQAVVQETQNKIEDLERAAEQMCVPDLDLEDSGPNELRALKDLKIAHRTMNLMVNKLKTQVLTDVDKIRQNIDLVLAGSHVKKWQNMLASSKAGYLDASDQLARQGIDGLEDYGTLVAEAARIRHEIWNLEQDLDRANNLDLEADRTLEQYREHCATLSRERAKFASEVTTENVRVTVDQFSHTEELPDKLDRIFGVTGRFERDIQVFVEKINSNREQQWDWVGLDDLVDNIRHFRSGKSDSWPCKDRRFERVLKDMEPEQLDRLSLYIPNEAVNVSFRDIGQHWKPLSRGSPGQQTAALLAFILGHGEEPIILDQPEDDLDSALIYDLLVRQIKQAKTKRQVILVTHNPNIVVHGDAEYVLSLHAENGQTCKACSGGLQEQAVRDEICKVMEGGKEAFVSRYRRIMTVKGDIS